MKDASSAPTPTSTQTLALAPTPTSAPTSFKHTNRLIHATSPYLLQHAHNPIDWYEWGEEAFAKAQAEDKPIFLSIGYSACHWCHVMEHETFENKDVATYVNERFVCIKVDREERPDVDEIYMHVTQMMNQGHGGWPMSLFLMPDKRPIYAGTYFPREQFLRVCEQIHKLWWEDREKMLEQGDAVQARIDAWASSSAPALAPDASIIPFAAVDQAATVLAGYFDMDQGGFRTNSNKFPPSMTMELLLRVYRRTKGAALREAVEVTLDHMACGGIYDHLGGGICRYSTDPEWLVPHFEKMLYDQALVSSIYLDAYQVTGKALYAQTARDIFDYVIADLQSPEGGFYSTRDADSEGLEGAYYIWTVPQVQQVLGAEEADLFCEYYDVTERGNWFESRGHAPSGPKNILRIRQPAEAFAQRKNISLDTFKKKLAMWREKMLAVRAKRVPPSLDDKILTGWNGLMIASLAKGARVLDEPKYAVAATRAADFVLKSMRRDGRLLRTYRAGSSRLTAYLSDYAFLIDGLLNLYEATFDLRWLQEADSLCQVSVEHYLDTENGGFFFTANDAEALLARSKNPRDGAIPSGNSVHASNLIRLATLLDNKAYRTQAESIFRAFKTQVESSPSQFERMLCAVDAYHDRTYEIVIVGPSAANETQRLLRAVFSAYLPNKVVMWAAGAEAEGTEGADAGGDSSSDGGGGGGGDTKLSLPLLRGKKAVQGKPTAYVCENYLCRKPVQDVPALRHQLGLE